MDFIADPLSAYLIMRLGTVGQDAGYRERVVEYCMVYGVAKYDEAKLWTDDDIIEDFINDLQASHWDLS